MSTPSTPSTNANIPGGAPLVDESRQIEQVWYQFLLALFNRTGGAGTPTDITGLTKQVTAQDVEINSFVPVPQRPTQGTEPFVAIPPPANAITYRPISNIFRSVESKLRDTVSLKDFGAKIDGITDDTAAVNAALASGALDVYFPPGTCVINGSVSIQLNGVRLRGAGFNASVFLIQNTNLPGVTVTTGLTGVQLWDFSITRTLTPTTGGDGVQWLLTNSQGFIANVHVQNCWRGFALGPTDYSKVSQCVAQQNYSYGFHVTNVGLGGPCQWSLDQCLSQNNNSHGMFIDASTGTSGGMSLGEISQFSTFANTGKGLIALGTAANPINGLRILGGFIGGDADDEIYLDTFGGQHKIIGAELELAGTSATGRNNATAASHIGHGVSITANNSRVQISDLNVNGTSLSGVASFGSITSLSNPHITNCGIAAVASDQNGVLVGAGRVTVTGGLISDTGQNSQLFGVSVGTGASVKLTGVDLTGNVTAPLTGAGVINPVNCFGVTLAKVLATGSVQSVVTGSQVTVAGWTTSLDATSSFNASTGIFTAPAAGDYLVSTGIDTGSAAVSGNQLNVVIVRNAANIVIGVNTMVPPSSSANGVAASALVRCVAGDTIKIQAFQNTSATITLAGGGGTYVSITQVV